MNMLPHGPAGFTPVPELHPNQSGLVTASLMLADERADRQFEGRPRLTRTPMTPTAAGHAFAAVALAAITDHQSRRAA